MGVLIDVQGLGKTFADTGLRLGHKRPPVRAVDGVSFQIARA